MEAEVGSLDDLAPKVSERAGSSVVTTAPSEDCARSGPDPADESTPAVFRPVDTPLPPDLVSLLPHAARARTRSTSVLVLRDFATVVEHLAFVASTSRTCTFRGAHFHSEWFVFCPTYFLCSASPQSVP